MNKYFLILGLSLGVLVLLNYWEIKKINKLVNSLLLSNNDLKRYIESSNKESEFNNTNNIDTIQKEIESYKREIDELDNQIAEDATINIENVDNLDNDDNTSCNISDINNISKDVDNNLNNIEYNQDDTLSEENIENSNNDLIKSSNMDTEGVENNEINESLLPDSSKVLEFYYDNYNVPDLKVLCKDHGLTVSGNKRNLIERLLESNILNPRIENDNSHIVPEQVSN